MVDVTKDLFQFKFPTSHVEVNFPWEKSLDSLHRKGFQNSYQIRYVDCLLERWDHPDGRYKLVIYKGGGLYISEDVNDPHWIEIIDVILEDSELPIPLVSENWFELEIFEHGKKDFNNKVRRLSSNEIPTTSAEWQKFAREYATKDYNSTISLRNGRSGKPVFSDTFRRNRDGSVRKVSQKKPKSSS